MDSCPHCGKTLVARGIKKHIAKVHVPHPDVKIPCQECTEKFVNEEELEEHVGSVHKKVFLCKKCGKDFSDNHFLVSHYRFKHRQVEPEKQIMHSLNDGVRDTHLEDACGPV
jgi:DNA-directed RNA polymerase subunit M/transcription elongation factor TFIIS